MEVINKPGTLSREELLSNLIIKLNFIWQE